MSGKINYILLSYQEKKEKVIIPENYEKLKLLFKEKYTIESPKNLKFNYKEDEKSYPIEEANFSEAIEAIKKSEQPYIYVNVDTFNNDLENMNGLFPTNNMDNNPLEDQANGSELLIRDNIISNYNNNPEPKETKDNLIKNQNKNIDLINNKDSSENNIKESQLNNTSNKILKKSINKLLNDLNNYVIQSNVSHKQDIEKLEKEKNNDNSFKDKKDIKEEENEIKANKIQLENMNSKIKILEAKVENLENTNVVNYKKIQEPSLKELKIQKKLEFINQYHRREKNSLINKSKKEKNKEKIIKKELKIIKRKTEQTSLKIQLIKQNNRKKNNSFEEYKNRTNQELIYLQKQLEESNANLNKKDEIIRSLNNVQTENRRNIMDLKNQFADFNITNEKDRVNNEKIKSLENEIIIYKNKISELNSKLKEEKEKNVLLIKEYKNKIEEKYKLKQKYFSDALNNIFVKSLKEKNKEILKNIDEVKKFKENIKKNINEKLMIKFDKDKYKNEIIYDAIKCNKCLKIPISNKNNKIGKNNIFNHNQNNNIINNYIAQENEGVNVIKNQDKDKYSFKCINQNVLEGIIVLERSKILNRHIIIENTGNKKWPSKAKLVFNEDCNFLIGKDIVLQPQKPGERRNYQIDISDLETYPYSKYAAELIFKVDRQQYGEKIDLNIEITINKDDIDKIEQFRKHYNLSKEHYSDNAILKALKEKNYDFKEAYVFLFQDVK